MYGRTDVHTDERTKSGMPHEDRPLLGPGINKNEVILFCRI